MGRGGRGRSSQLPTGQDLGNTKVSELEQTPRRHEDVLGLQIPVQDLTVVNVLHGEADLHEPVDDRALVQQLATPLLQDIVQVAFGAPFHHNVQLAVLDEALVAGDNVGVLERLEDLKRPRGPQISRGPANRGAPSPSTHLDLLHGSLLLRLGHARHVDLLDHKLLPIRLARDQDRLRRQCMVSPGGPAPCTPLDAQDKTLLALPKDPWPSTCPRT